MLKKQGKTQNEFEKIRYDAIQNLKFQLLNLSYRPAHVHRAFEIILVVSGTLNAKTPDAVFTASADEVMVFHPYLVHELSSRGSSCIILVIQVDPDFCSSYFPVLNYVRFDSVTHPNIQFEREDHSASRYCYNIGYNYFCGVPGFELMCMSDINRLFFFMLNHYAHKILAEDEYASNLSNNQRLYRIINYIRQHYTEKLSLSDIADRESLSLTYLSHFLKDHLGMSFQEYINTLRFEHAILLLKQTNKKIIDVCMESGFSDSKQLNKYFLKNYNMTPKEFRKSSVHDITPQTLTSNESSSQYIYSREETIRLLREHHTFICDMPGSVNKISDIL